MKKASWMAVCLGVAFVLTGCESEQDRYVVYSTYPPAEPAWAPPPSIWARAYHRLWNDGYSFNNDPTNPDVLAPVLGLDTAFPPAPLPYKSITP